MVCSFIVSVGLALLVEAQVGGVPHFPWLPVVFPLLVLPPPVDPFDGVSGLGIVARLYFGNQGRLTSGL